MFHEQIRTAKETFVNNPSSTPGQRPAGACIEMTGAPHGRT